MRVFDRNQWWPAKVLEVADGKALVRFRGWKKSWDKWVDLHSAMVRHPTHGDAPSGLPLAMPEVGAWLQAEDRGHWYDAKVVKTKKGAVFVHWHGFKKSAQRWVPLVHARIRILKLRSPSPQHEHPPDAPPPPREMPETPHAEDEEAPPIDPAAVVVGAHVRVKYGSEWYSAKVIDGDETQEGLAACVHFLGYNKRFDEWLALDEGRMKLPSPHRSPRSHAAAEEEEELEQAVPVDVPVGASVLCYQGGDCELEGDAAVAGATTGEANAPRPTDGVGTDSMDDDSAPVVEARSETTTDVEAATTMLSIAPTTPSHESTTRQDVGDANNNNDSPPPASSSSPSLDDRAAVHGLIMQKAELVDKLADVERKLQVVRQQKQKAQQTNAQQTRVSHASASNNGKTTMPWKKRPLASAAGGTASWVHGPPRYDSEIHVPFPNQKRRGTKLQRLAATS